MKRSDYDCGCRGPKCSRCGQCARCHWAAWCRLNPEKEEAR